MTKHLGCHGWARRGWAFALILWTAPAGAEPYPTRPSNEAIGSWILSCPSAVREPCLMRHRDWVVPPADGMPGAALEVQRRGGLLVPVIAVRGLTTPAMVGSAAITRPSVSLVFDRAQKIDLSCGISGPYLACAPDAASMQNAATALPHARVVSASVVLMIPGAKALPPIDRSLDLADTDRALIRLRVTGAAAGESLPALPGLDLQGLVDRLMRDPAFPNEAAGTISQLLSFASWLRSGRH